jgi:hypothetical protein
VCRDIPTELHDRGVRGSVVGWGTLQQAGRSRERIPDEVDFFNLPNSSSRTMALGSTQPLTQMSARNMPGGKGRPARKADNLTAICEPIVYKMWEPQHLTTLWDSTACYRDTFTYYMIACMKQWTDILLCSNRFKSYSLNCIDEHVSLYGDEFIAMPFPSENKKA